MFKYQKTQNNSLLNANRTDSIRRQFAAMFVLTLLVFQNILIISPNEAKAAVLVSNNIVISQVYGGGGNSGAQYTNDFIELFNRGTSTVNINNWSVQYASSTGSSWAVTTLTGSIAPGQYFLVQQAAGAGSPQSLPTPDVTGTIAMSGTAGKVALSNTNTALTGTCPTGGSLVDFVGYGTATNCSEGSPTATLSNSTAAIRKGGGCTDTDQNSADFTVTAPAPRNSSSTQNSCSGGSTNPSGAGAANPNPVDSGNNVLLTVTVTPGTSPASTGINVAGDLSLIGGSAMQAFFDNGTNGDVTAGDNIFSFNASVPMATSSGAKSLPITITDAQSRTGNTSINLTVNSTAPSSPTGVGSATPGTITSGGTTLLKVTVTPGTNPVSTGLMVFTDLTSIGGSMNQQFYDDGTNGDATAGDNVFSYDATVAAMTTPGAKTLTATISDAQMRSGSANISLVVSAPPTGQPLPFSQNWTNTGMITVDNDWSGVPGIIGYRGDDLTTAVGADPQNILTDGSTTPVNIIANQTAPDLYTSGGNVEFELANPVVAFQGSGTADAPNIVVSIDTTAQSNITVSYNLRDVDNSADNSVQPVALQYRIGANGDFTNIPAAFVADATQGPNLATLVTPVAVSLPAVVNNNPLVQLRFITTNAIGSDEFVGIDDINIVSNGTVPLSGVGSANPNDVNAGNPTLLKVAVNPATNPASTNISVTADLTSIGGSANQQFYDDGTNGDVAAGDNIFSYSEIVSTGTSGGNKTLPVSISDAESRTASASIPLLVRVPANQEEHLMMGNPSGATTDANEPFNYLLVKDQYVMSYHRDRGIPNWVSWHLDSSWIGSTPRQDDFRPDQSLPSGWYQVQATDYVPVGFDRGHHTPSGDRTSSVADNSATFFMTNMMPQAPDNNQGPWEKLESFSRTLVSQGNELYIITGSVGVGGIGSNGGVTNTLANGRVTVPAYTWKVILVLPVGDNDVQRVDNNTRAIAVIMPNTQGIRNDTWQKYTATVDQVEALTGYDFFSKVPVAIQDVIESRIDAATNTSPQTVSAGTYTDLNIIAPTTSLTGDITVTGNLTLGGSTLTTGSNKIILGPNATVTRLSGFVDGNVEKQFNNPATFEYPVGTQKGYSPVTATVTALGQTPSSLTVKAVQSVQPNVTSMGFALNRYWTLTENGDLTTNLIFKYLDADVPIGLNENAFKLQKYDGAFSEVPATINATANTASTTGISQFSDWTLIAPSIPTAALVSVDGRVISPQGQSVSGASVIMTDQNGQQFYSRTNPFGYFHFKEIEAGNNYVVNVQHKSYRFTPQVVNVTEDITNLTIIASP